MGDAAQWAATLTHVWEVCLHPDSGHVERHDFSAMTHIDVLITLFFVTSVVEVMFCLLI